MKVIIKIAAVLVLISVLLVFAAPGIDLPATALRAKQALQLILMVISLAVALFTDLIAVNWYAPAFFFLPGSESRPVPLAMRC